MFIRIDESHGHGVFVVAGVAADNLHDIEEPIRRARGLVRRQKRSGKPVVVPEFKESYLFPRYPEILDDVIRHTAHVYPRGKGKGEVFPSRNLEITAAWEQNPHQKQQQVLSELTLRVLTELCAKHGNYDVVLDQYGHRKYQKDMCLKIREVAPKAKFSRLEYRPSKQCLSLQLADVVAGTIRRYLAHRSVSDEDVPGWGGSDITARFEVLRPRVALL